MPRVISGIRRARSMVTPAGAEVATRVLDFNFPASGGIEVIGVLGSVGAFDASPAVSDTVPAKILISQSLHLEEGTIENIPFNDGEDADEIDTEVFFHQVELGTFQVPATAGGGGGTAASGTLYIPYDKPVLVARNITHRGELSLTGQLSQCHVLIFYRHVVFSDAELGFLLARRS